MWDALSSKPVTAAQLAEQLNYAPGSTSSIRRHVARLQMVGLAQRTPDGWIRGKATPHEAAETACCTGESDWYRTQNQRIRQRWHRRNPRREGRHLFVVQAAPRPADRLPHGRYAYAWGYRTVTTYDDNGYLIRTETPPAPHRVAADIAA